MSLLGETWALRQVLSLQTVPGVSALSWTPQGLYVIADNVAGLYVLDPQHFQVKKKIALDSIQGLKPVPKKEKPDFEAALIQDNTLFVFGSGSTDERRETVLKMNLATLTVQQETASTLYQSIKNQGFEVNIEGATAFGEYWLLANRGHQGQPLNHLLKIHNYHVLSLQALSVSQQPFVGISALEYDAKIDRLWFTGSTEATSSVYEDGAIGDSYLGWIDHYTDQCSQTSLHPTQVINLSQLSSQFQGQKIEGITLMSDHSLLLGSDNDGSQAILFVLGRSAAATAS